MLLKQIFQRYFYFEKPFGFEISPVFPHPSAPFSLLLLDVDVLQVLGWTWDPSWYCVELGVTAQGNSGFFLDIKQKSIPPRPLFLGLFGIF